MRILSNSQEQVINYLLSLSNGNLALVEEALRHIAGKTFNKNELDDTYTALLEYIFKSMNDAERKSVLDALQKRAQDESPQRVNAA